MADTDVLGQFSEIAKKHGFDNLEDAVKFVKELLSHEGLVTGVVEQVEDDTSEEEEAEITPWKVVGDVSDTGKLLEKLIKKFGCSPIDEELIVKIERLTGKPAPMWLRRGIVFAHRGLNEVLDKYEQGIPFYLYTGRGPTSAALHLGHLISYIFTAEIGKLFNVPVVVQIADDEKVSFRDVSWEDMERLTYENVKDLIACGFDPEKTFIFSNREMSSSEEYKMCYRDVANSVNINTIMKVFGLEKSQKVGCMDWTVWQTVPCFSGSFGFIFQGRQMQCLVIYGLDQDPYFRVARDYAGKKGLPKPAGLICTFLPPLTGDGKMSASDKSAPTLFTTLTEEEIRKLVKTHCFSGGRDTKKEQMELGANLDVDMAVKYMIFFKEDMDRINEIKRLYGPGELEEGEERMMSGQVKDEMADDIVRIIGNHQVARAAVTDEVMRKFYKKRKIDVSGPVEKRLYALLNKLGIRYKTLYHPVIKTMEEGKELLKRLKGVVPVNLFFQDENGQLYLIIKSMQSELSNKDLAQALGVEKLSRADLALLGVPPGCVTVFGLLNNSEVKVVVDGHIPKDGKVNFHPLINDATTTITYEHMMRFITYCRNEVVVLE